MMTFYRPTSASMPFYGGDYRPDDEPPPEAVLEEKRILEHQFRRPSPSRLSSTASSIRPPTATRQGGGISANRSLRARPSGSSPRRSLQRSSAFGNRRSTTITDRGRTASMPAVPIVRPSFGNVPRPDGPVLEEYRLRSFSITASGVCNLGDFVRYASPPSSTRHHQPVGKRESCPASVSGTPSHQQNVNGSSAATAATTSHTVCTEFSRFRKPSRLGGFPVIVKEDISCINEDCACRTIRVMINGQEAELTIIDIPYIEMSKLNEIFTHQQRFFIKRLTTCYTENQ
ncbi:PREDICTED: uncharacterized protein LOC107168530 [Diuraphis noxia]|uniref:uncharacterized protein LOC107168530 n=1 Tax=Diuraphis noxia TaxID=143948 RepID=UPI000763629D|nr:PREDICTED: uncharacterized protein LOC107168530 [Diuraphis noxia]